MIRFRFSDLKLKNNLMYILAVSFIGTQVYFFTNFLPFSLYFATFIVWTWYYLLIDFLLDKIKENFFWRKKWKKVLILILIFISLLVTLKY